MRVVRGSHKLGLLNHNTTADGFFNAEPYEVSTAQHTTQAPAHHTRTVPQLDSQGCLTESLCVVDVAARALGGRHEPGEVRLATTCHNVLRDTRA